MARTIRSRGLRRPAWLLGVSGVAIAGVAALAVALPQALAGPASPGTTARVSSGDSPAGFWYGTDSTYIPIPGSNPYQEPAIGGAYGGYMGMIGNWANWKGCRGKVVWSRGNAIDARLNYFKHHAGIGDGAYWFMAGPGVDPHYNGTTKEAAAWGRAQAAQALRDMAKSSPKITYPVLILDVELPGDAPSFTPAPDNGWNSVYTSACSGRVKSNGIAAKVDRADFNGFADYVTSHSSYQAGVYSAPSIWADIFGTGSASSLSNTYEWTYTGDTSSLSHKPAGWCLAGTKTCAQFFGGITGRSKYALMWQWSGGGGTFNGVGDFDQIDKNRTP
jgi:hypothetical protein